MATNGVRSHVWKINCTNEQPNEVVVIGDAESSLENFTVHDFYGKNLTKRKMIPGKLYCTWLSWKNLMRLRMNSENEFLCSNLRLHILVSSEVQKSVGVSKGVEFKSGTFFTKGRKPSNQRSRSNQKSQSL